MGIERVQNRPQVSPNITGRLEDHFQIGHADPVDHHQDIFDRVLLELFVDILRDLIESLRLVKEIR